VSRQGKPETVGEPGRQSGQIFLVAIAYRGPAGPEDGRGPGRSARVGARMAPQARAAACRLSAFAPACANLRVLRGAGMRA